MIEMSEEKFYEAIDVLRDEKGNVMIFNLRKDAHDYVDPQGRKLYYYSAVGNTWLVASNGLRLADHVYSFIGFKHLDLDNIQVIL